MALHGVEHMFGPNAQPSFHHRCPMTHMLLDQTKDLLQRRCCIPPDYDILFLTGSGTLANEAVIWSLRDGLKCSVNTVGHFSQRLAHTLKAYGKYNEGRNTNFQVQYETSESKHNAVVNLGRCSVNMFDCVSGFPYYPFPEHANAATMVAGKQLGCAPGLSMVAVHCDDWDLFRQDFTQSYLNLWRYQDAYKTAHETPHTPALQSLIELRRKLTDFDLQKHRLKIDMRRLMLEKIVSPDCHHGEGPVFTFTDNGLEKYRKVLGAIGVYRHPAAQLFLWSGSEYDFMNLLGALKDA